MFKTRITGYFLFVILIINLLFRLGIAISPFENLDPFIPDDSFLSLKISKNIAEGKGPLYGNNYTNGFQPLFVFLMVPIYKIFPNNLMIPLRSALIINSIFDTLTLLLILKIILISTNSKFAMIFASVAWIFNSYIISTTMNGLETMISTFTQIFLIYYIIINRILESTITKYKQFFVFGLISGVAAFARIDNIILSLILYLIVCFNILAKKKDFLQFVKISFFILAGFLTAYSPWIIYSYLNTGLIYPISGKAVRYQTTYHVMNLESNFGFYFGIFKRSVKTILMNNLALWFSLLVTLIYIVVKNKIKTTLVIVLDNRYIIVLMLFCVTLILSYTIYLPATWFFARYYFSFVIFLILLTSILIGNFRFLNSKLSIFFIFTSFILIELIGFYNKGIFFENKQIDRGYIEIGKYIKTAFPVGTIIGSSQTGAFGYFAENLKVINLDGVVNQECYQSLVNKRNMDYIRSQNIQYILGWDINIKFIKNNSKYYKENDLIKIQTIPNIKSWGNYWNIYKVNSDYEIK